MAAFFSTAPQGASSLPCSLITGGQGCSSLCCCVQRQQREERSDPGVDGNTRYCKCNKTFKSWKSTNITSLAEAISTTCSTSINVHHISAWTATFPSGTFYTTTVLVLVKNTLAMNLKIQNSICFQILQSLYSDFAVVNFTVAAVETMCSYIRNINEFLFWIYSLKKKDNKIKRENADKLCFLHYNIRLLNWDYWLWGGSEWYRTIIGYRLFPAPNYRYYISL